MRPSSSRSRRPGQAIAARPSVVGTAASTFESLECRLLMSVSLPVVATDTVALSDSQTLRSPLSAAQANVPAGEYVGPYTWFSGDTAYGFHLGKMTVPAYTSYPDSVDFEWKGSADGSGQWFSGYHFSRESDGFYYQYNTGAVLNPRWSLTFAPDRITGTRYVSTVSPDGNGGWSYSYQKEAEIDLSRKSTIPDLVLTDATTADLRTFKFTYTVSSATSSPFTVRAFLSEDSTYQRGMDTELSGEVRLAAPENLVPGSDGSAKSYTASLRLDTRAPVKDDRRFVILVADSADEVSETDESNNARFAIPIVGDGEMMNRVGEKGQLTEAASSASGPFTGAILRGTEDFSRLRRIDAASGGPWPFSFNYQTEPDSFKTEDKQAQESLLSPLAAFVDRIRDDSRYWGTFSGFTINEAYDSTGGHSRTSLHYEGRALDIQARDRESLTRLTGLAWLAGFDFAYNESGHLHVSERASFPTSVTGSSMRAAVTEGVSLGLVNSTKAIVIDSALALLEKDSAAGDVAAVRRDLGLAIRLVYSLPIVAGTGASAMANVRAGFARLLSVNLKYFR